jgi:ssDNA-binding Zn-finger/Zn-ribbon topoisomerase 1
MSLVVHNVIRVYCPQCDYLEYFHDDNSVPKICPACGGDKVWEKRQEEIQDKIWIGFPSRSKK